MSEAKEPGKDKKARPSRSRRKSRELALKAIYSDLMKGGDLKQVLAEMKDDADYEKADEAYFKTLLTGVKEKTAELDSQIADFTDRKVNELSPVEHAILRIAAFELVFDVSIPYRVVINEGVELAKMYGGADGHKYINGVLDKLAAKARPHEFRR